MIDVTTTGMAFLTGLGLPEVLLWVLAFAVIFGILTKLQIFGKGRAAPALISIVVGFMVLLAVPAALISVISSMSTGLLVVAIGFLVIMSLIEFTGTKAPYVQYDNQGKPAGIGYDHPFKSHSTVVAILLIVIAAIIFWDLAEHL